MQNNEPVENLEQSIVAQIIDTILVYKQVEKIVVFGSRAINDSKETSDIDIAIFEKKYTDSDINLVKDQLEECVNTPLKFDVLNFYAITNDKLKNNILKYGRVIYGF